jgi:hypothetical protein
MFADQITTAAVVIALSRPQIAILDFYEKSVFNLRGKKTRPWVTHPRSARRKEAIDTANHEKASVQRNQACTGLDSSVPNEDTPEQPLTLQLNSEVRLNPMKLRVIDPKAHSRAMRYTVNDHFHGRLPVNTSHSKSRVVTNSHLGQAHQRCETHAMQQDRSAQIDTTE